MPELGGYSLHTIDAGRFKLDGGAMFGVVPKPLWERKMPADDRNRIQLATRCLLLAGHDRVILVDTGIGSVPSEKFKDIFAVDYSQTSLDGALEQNGYSRRDVTDVILTHLHFDHCGGGTIGEGSDARLSFPNATYHLQEEHWQWARNPNAREAASFRSDNLDPLAQSDQLNLLTDAHLPFPNLDLIIVNGHTRAQQLVKVTGREGVLVYVADLLPTTAHFSLPWIMAYDVAPLDTLDEKAQFLNTAHKNGWNLFLEHDPTTAVVSVGKDEKGFHPAEERTLSDLHRTV